MTGARERPVCCSESEVGRGSWKTKSGALRDGAAGGNRSGPLGAGPVDTVDAGVVTGTPQAENERQGGWNPRRRFRRRSVPGPSYRAWRGSEINKSQSSSMWNSRRSPISSITQIVRPSSVRSSTKPLWHSTPRWLRVTASPRWRDAHVDTRRLCNIPSAFLGGIGIWLPDIRADSCRGRAVRALDSLGHGNSPGLELTRIQMRNLLLKVYRRLLTIARMRTVPFQRRRARQFRAQPTKE